MSTPTLRKPVRAIWIELTGKCQLECVHCYAGSSPEGTHGTMTAENWEKVLDDARALGTRFVCFIGGEPTLNPDLPRLVRYALSLGMTVEVFSNLVAVSSALWELFERPGVRLATSWYSSDRAEHREITKRDTWRQTLANIEKAVARGIPLRAGVIDGLVPGQRFEEGKQMLRERGVTSIGGDHLREFGRGTTCDPSQACGNCGDGRAAVLPDGSVTPCPLTRWMKGGNVLDTPLADVMPGVVEQASALPNWRGRCFPEACGPDVPCKPSVTADCMPICGPMCGPANCGPIKAEVTACGPDCGPGAGDCRPAGEACRPGDVMDACRPYTNCAPGGVCKPAHQDMAAACSPDFVCEAHCVPGGVAAVADPCGPDACAPDYICGPCGPDVRAEAAPVTDMPGCMPDPCNPYPDCEPYASCRPDWGKAEAAVTAGAPDCYPDYSPCQPHNACGPDGCKPATSALVPAGGPDPGPDVCSPDDPDEDGCRPNQVCGPAIVCGPHGMR